MTENALHKFILFSAFMALTQKDRKLHNQGLVNSPTAIPLTVNEFRCDDLA